MHSTDSSALIRDALGAEAVLGGIEEVEASIVWPEIEEALFYLGDDGAGPSDSVLQSESFLQLIAELKNEILRLVGASNKIQRFWLQDGHPAYPVFWDFAFLFCVNDNATIFIGSSSD